MLLSLVWTTLLSLAAALPVEYESTALAVRDAGELMPLEPRSSSGVTYTINQNFVVNSAGPSFNGPFSPDGVSFYFQGDGNFVVYNGETVASNAVWNSGTGGHSVCSDASQCFLAFLGNGNLVVYIGGTLSWQTGTAGKGYTVAFMGSAPYIIIYNKSNKAIWNSGGGPSGGNPPPGGPCSRSTDVICP